MNQEKPLEEDIETALLTDLPLSIAQAEEAKAGFGGVTLIGPPETAAVKILNQTLLTQANLAEETDWLRTSSGPILPAADGRHSTLSKRESDQRWC